MLKRTFDIILSIVGIIILSPIFIVVTILIKSESKGPAFFKQLRVGKNGKEFYIFKFRSMAKNQDKKDLKITVANDKRITKIGSFIRKYKIDELPQLINVVKSEMSIVGPRPEVPEYVKYYSIRDRKIILSVKPGITDLASIEFRNESQILAESPNPEKSYIKIILPKKLKYCRFYVKNRSFTYDIMIILKTFKAIII